MRVMVFVKATASSENGAPPSKRLMDDMGRFNQQLMDAGIIKGGDGLKPSKFGARVAFDGAKRTVTDGPFAATKELVAGYWLWDVKDLQEAIDWVKRCPNPMPEASEIEIRPLYTMEDYEAWAAAAT